MASITPHVRLRLPRRHARSWPFDALGAIALAWAGVFLALAFGLGWWLG
jgi:hypothetical protein